MSDKMLPGGEEHDRFMKSVVPAIRIVRDRALAKYKDNNEKGTADGWFIATLFSLAITIGQKGGLNNTQLRAVFEMYLETIDNHPATPSDIDPRTLINKDPA